MCEYIYCGAEPLKDPPTKPQEPGKPTSEPEETLPSDPVNLPKPKDDGRVILI